MNAYLNWGRWVVDCPNPGCLSAMAVDAGSAGTVCMCRDVEICDHGPACLAIIRPVWPDDLELIEAVLAGRPRRNRNWIPGETVAGLELENLMHGVT